MPLSHKQPRVPAPPPGAVPLPEPASVLSGHERLPLGPFARRVLVVIGLVTLVGVLLYGAFSLFNVLLLVFGGLLFAVFLDAVAGFLVEKAGMNRKLALGLTLLLLVGILGGAGWLIGPSIVEQGAALGDAVPEAYGALRDNLQANATFGNLARDLPTVEEVQGMAMGLTNQIPGLFTSLVGGVTTFFVVLILGVYFAFNPSLYARGVVALAPFRRRERANEVLFRVGQALKKWLVGQFVSMAFVGVACTIGLIFLDVPLAFALGFLAFLLDFIPILGPFIAAAPALLIAFLVGPETALYVAILYVIVQQIESYVILPNVQHKMVDLPPVMLILAQVLMGTVAGLLGVTLATPLIVAVIVLVQMLYVEDVLGDYKVDVLGARNTAEEPIPDLTEEEVDDGDGEAEIKSALT